MTASTPYNLFHVGTYDEPYWKTYLAARPKYSKEFYDQIYAYHQTYGNGSFSLAHDIATGPGQVATELTEHFEHVIASDMNSSHLAVAQHRLSDLHSAQKVSFVLASGEEISAKCPTQSVDLIAAAECVALMDTERAITSFASLLRPKGTLAIWFYGRPTFAEDSYAARCQSLYDQIVTKEFSKIIMGGGPEKRKRWQTSTNVMVNWLDNIALPAADWAHVKRFKWNPDAQMVFYGSDACDSETERISHVSPDEEVTERTDRSFWEKGWNLEQTKAFVRVNLPSFQEVAEVDEEMDRLWDELGEAMGGRDVVRRITWPVVLILATKK